VSCGREALIGKAVMYTQKGSMRERFRFGDWAEGRKVNA
jgi:hypothetical protein